MGSWFEIFRKSLLIPKRQFSQLFSILQLVKSLPFYIPPAWKRYPLRAEPPRIVHYREYPLPGTQTHILEKKYQQVKSEHTEMQHCMRPSPASQSCSGYPCTPELLYETRCFAMAQLFSSSKVDTLLRAMLRAMLHAINHVPLSTDKRFLIVEERVFSLNIYPAFLFRSVAKTRLRSTESAQNLSFSKTTKQRA